MDLKEKINEDLKSAMKSGDKLRLETIRSIRAAILEFEKSGNNKEFNEEESIRILNSAAKKRKDSIELFGKAGRTDLEEKEKAELEIIMSYLPKQLSNDELKEVVKNIAASTGSTGKEDFSKLMPLVMKELKGKADGKVVRAIVEEFLNKN